MLPIRPQAAKPIIAALLCLFAASVVLIAASCRSGSGSKKGEAKAAASSFEDSLYQSYIYTALSYRGDSLLHHLDSILPGTYSENYRIKAYRSFLYGYRLFKQRKADTAEHIVRNMLPKNGLDTARDYELLTLQQGMLLLVKLQKGAANHLTFGQLMKALALAERYPARFRWWIYSMATDAWFRVGEPLKARSYAWLAYESIPDTTDYAVRGFLMYHIAETERLQDNLDAALRYADSAHTLAARSDDKKLVSAVLQAKSQVLVQLGDTARGYRLQQQVMEQNKAGSKEQQVSGLVNSAKANYDKGNFSNAVEYCRKAAEAVLENNDPYTISNVYKIMAESYHALKRYDSSFYYLTESYNNYIRYLNQLQAREIASLGIQHTLEKEINEKKGLAEKSKVQEAEIESRNTIVGQQRIIILAAVAVFILLLVLGFIMVRQARLRSAMVRAETEKEKVQLQQRLYRSQMEPHFISNTLAASVAFMRGRKFDEATEHLTRFGKLLRVNLEHSLQPLVPLYREIEALENYIILQHMRFRDLFEYSIDVYEHYEEDDLYIPPMLLQPFVENAIYHGFHNIDYKGRLSIVIKNEGGLLHCEIEDNGRGLQNGENSGKKKSVATAITRDRLQLLSHDKPQKADLKIINKADQGMGSGTLVIISIPYQVSFPQQDVALTS